MAQQSFEEIFDRFNGLNVLIIGDAMVDAYIWGDVERMSPEAPIPIVNVHKKDFRLGGAVNVALNIKAMGANPILCSVIGKDENGSKLSSMLIEQGIAEGVFQSENRPTTVKTRVISNHQHIVRIDEEVTDMIDNRETKELLNNIERYLPKCQVVIFEDYDKGCITPEVIAYTVKLAKTHRIPTVVDPKNRNFLHYKEVTLFKPNLKELKEGLEIDFDVTDQSALQSAVVQLRNELQCEQVLITLSEHGVYMDKEGTPYYISAHLRKIVDVSGAGDTVISIASLGVAIGLSPYLITALSNLAGGLVCERIGVVTIDRNQLMNEAMDKLKS